MDNDKQEWENAEPYQDEKAERHFSDEAAAANLDRIIETEMPEFYKRLDEMNASIGGETISEMVTKLSTFRIAQKR